MQGKSRITSHLPVHHIATSDIASTDVGPGLPSLGQEGKTKVFVTNVKLLTTAAMVDNLAEKVDECPLNRDR